MTVAPRELVFKIKDLPRGFPKFGLARDTLEKANSKSAPNAAYSGQIVDPGSAGYPCLGGWLEKAILNPT